MIGVMVPSVFGDRASLDDYKNMKITISNVEIIEQEYRDFISYTVTMRDSNLKVHEDYRILPKVIRTFIDYGIDGTFGFGNDPKTFSSYTKDGEEGCEWADDYHYLSGADGGIYNFKMCNYVEKDYDEFLIILDYSRDCGERIVQNGQVIRQDCNEDGYSFDERNRIIERFSKDSGIFGTTVTTLPAEVPIQESSEYDNKIGVISRDGEGLGKKADAAILVMIDDLEFLFYTAPYQMQDPYIFFSGGDGNTIHRNHEDATIELLFNSMDIGLDDQCYVFPERTGYASDHFCVNDDYSLKYFINGKPVSGILDYIIQNNDRILIIFGNETDEQIREYISQLNLIVIKSDSVFKSGASSSYGDRQITWDGASGTSHLSPKLDESITAPEEKTSEGGGCLIATATYGSELAPQVQQLRELRDNQLLQTESGTAFITAFNDIYYSFSPIIADYERENPLFKEAVKIAITPMISTLSLMENANSESEVISLGLSVIMLNIGMYLAVPAVVIVGIKKKF